MRNRVRQIGPAHYLGAMPVPRLAFLSLLLCACPHPKPPVSAACSGNTTLQFKRIDERAQKRTGDPGNVYWSRYYLETARFVLTGKGIDGSGAPCSVRDHEGAQYDAMLHDLKSREKTVEALETARGVKFNGVVHAGLTWTWTANSQPVSQNDANTL